MTARLALGNIRKSMHDYAVYFITLALGVAVFYAFNTISAQATFVQGDVGEILKAVGDILQGVTFFLAVVMGFLMVYANNFLLRRRKKELGLYQVLGMRRGQVARILTLETLVVALVSLAAGVLLGFLLSQLLLFVTGSLFKVAIRDFHFFFSLDALGVTAGCFAVTFVVMMVFNGITLRRVRLIDLMGARRRGETNRLRSLPLSVALFAVGVALVGVAYARLLHHGLPGATNGTSQATFNVTTIMMMAGTVLLFFGLAGTAVALLTRTKRLYWRDLHAFTTRQFAARVNSGSLSMAMISLILFLAITSVTAGMSICSAINEAAERNVAYDASVAIFPAEGTGTPDGVSQALAGTGVDLDAIGSHATVTLYDASDLADGAGMSMNAVMQATGQELPSGFSADNYATAMGLSDFNALGELKGLSPIELGEHQYLVTSSMANVAERYSKALAKGYSFTIGGTRYTPALDHAVTDSSAVVQNSTIASNPGIYVLPDDVVASCPLYQTVIDFEYSHGTAEGDRGIRALADALDGAKVANMTGTATETYSEGSSTTGVVSYLALYIGFVLVVACAAILAIQQLSSAEDSSPAYQTLSELGCPTRLVYGSLRTQTVLAFVLPLVVGLAHSACALAVVVPLVETFGLVNLASSSVMAATIFVVVYGGYLLLTYRTEHAMVHAALERRRHAL
jgi:putative ABC transport system permease protein